MKKLFLKLLAAIALFPEFAFAQWTLDAAPEFMAESGWQLRFNLVYSGTVTVNTDRSSLPWGICDSIKLHATTSPFIRPVTELEKAYYIDDPGYDPITISP